MGNSTIKLKDVYNAIAARGVPDPRGGASGYGDTLALELANQVSADLICERYNWKWNSAVATPFYTNSWQQDYPQPQQPQGLIGWGENCTLVDINNTVVPKPLWNITWRKQLLRTSASVGAWRCTAICWMYNKDLILGGWPGAGVTYYPLLGVNAPTGQNPIMSMLDGNGNILTVTGFGTTGSAAPELPENSNEGTTVVDGTVTWTCVSPTSQGFRLDNLPSAAGPTYQVTPTFQIVPPRFTGMNQTLDPIPDHFSRYFYRCLNAECLMASVNPGDLARGEKAKAEALNALTLAIKQGDQEMNVFGMVPATSVVETRWGWNRPFTADNPY